MPVAQTRRKQYGLISVVVIVGLVAMMFVALSEMPDKNHPTLHWGEEAPKDIIIESWQSNSPANETTNGLKCRSAKMENEYLNICIKEGLWEML